MRRQHRPHATAEPVDWVRRVLFRPSSYRRLAQLACESGICSPSKMSTCQRAIVVHHVEEHSAALSASCVARALACRLLNTRKSSRDALPATTSYCTLSRRCEGSVGCSAQMDALDPGRFIMWLMGGVLASCWLILLIKSTLPTDWYSAHPPIPCMVHPTVKHAPIQTAGIQDSGNAPEIRLRWTFQPPDVQQAASWLVPQVDLMLGSQRIQSCGCGALQEQHNFSVSCTEPARQILAVLRDVHGDPAACSRILQQGW